MMEVAGKREKNPTGCIRDWHTPAAGGWCGRLPWSWDWKLQILMFGAAAWSADCYLGAGWVLHKVLLGVLIAI